MREINIISNDLLYKDSLFINTERLYYFASKNKHGISLINYSNFGMYLITLGFNIEMIIPLN